MFTYYLRLALKSLRRTPVIAALMIGAIALGVGVCITTLTVYRLMSGNPIEHRNDVLYAVTLDNWDPNNPWDERQPDLPPMELTYRDAMALLDEAIKHKVAFVPGSPFYANAPETHTLRLSFVTVPPERIRAGIEILGKLIASKL